MDCGTCSSLCCLKTTLRRFKEDNDFNNVTLVYEDGTQVRHTKSSSLHPVHNNTIFKQQKSKSQLEQIYSSNGNDGVEME